MNIFPKFQKILRALCFYFGIWFKILRKYIVCTLGAQAEVGREKISEISLEPEILRKQFLPWEIQKYNFFSFRCRCRAWVTYGLTRKKTFSKKYLFFRVQRLLWDFARSEWDFQIFRPFSRKYRKSRGQTPTGTPRRESLVVQTTCNP